ncbi:MAG: hypothetical protein D6744_05340 [Planctomycetota bacterium]|nr:MAG: hypothetical protein D6744_05340 [Planctomycetota bacterium]
MTIGSPVSKYPQTALIVRRVGLESNTQAMNLSRRNRGGGDPRELALRDGDEIRIGAYARRQRLRTLAIALVGLGMVVGAVVMYLRIRPPAGSLPSRTYPVVVHCEACGHEANLQVPFDAVFPIKCPRCGRMTALAAWRCRDCGKTFVPESTREDVTCPECGSEAVGSAAAKP